MASRVISKAQFSTAHAHLKHDPNDSGEVDHGRGGNPKFGGAPGKSKTMKVSGGRLPPPQKRHRHHRHNAPRTRRAR